ncbi:guanine-specific ribonuclease N1 and T1 [Streptomyces sp. NBC_01077]|uniref:ribonuclease domain-containing protein n=1 Tax=Streptomyces sp. NBC_01077 TaxID=2903746 RepID=UPI0038640E39|nr:guanine-specific ribonuclease N1 and T1 [Streptomyces sp. NBC_01077]
MLLRPLRVLLALVLCVFLAGCSSASGGADPVAPARTTATAAAPTGTSGLPTVRASDLPPEARRTLELIARGGPFPYAKDGAVFSNFERILPREQRGYYREYTVKTPGERDRGARRIVTGRNGEIYWTDDHYDSFREVITDEN